MKAAWYDRQGQAADVLRVGEVADPSPGPGEVRVRLRYSGVNPGDVKKRQGWLGSPMPFPRVIPHSDGSGVIDAVGSGVDRARLGRRVWVYGAQSYRPFGTAAEATVVPDRLAIDLPASVTDQLGATLGIPGITAHRAVFADGPVAGRTVLVHGVLGGGGSIAAALAAWGGATVIGTVRGMAELDRIDRNAVRHAVPSIRPSRRRRFGPRPPMVWIASSRWLCRQTWTSTRIGAPGQCHRRLLQPPQSATDPVLAAAVRQRHPATTRQRRLPDGAKQQAAQDLTVVAAARRLDFPIAPAYPFDQIAEAHEAVEAGARGGRVLVALQPLAG